MDCELVGETLKFPTSPQAVEALLKNIGVDGIRYEAYGRDVSINEGGHFAPGGYIVQTGDIKEGVVS